MREIEYGRDASLLSSEFLSLRVARFFITLRDRNAWHSTTSRQYRGQTSLTNSLEAATEVAEEWRQMGSAFRIREVPGLALFAHSGVAVAVDFHHDNSFGSWDVTRGKRSLAQGTELRSVLRALGAEGTWTVSPNPHSLIHATSPGAPIAKAGERAEFSTYISYSDGGQYQLGWRKRADPAVSARGAHRIRRAFIAVNGKGSLDSGLEKYRIAEREHREALLTRFRERRERRERERTTAEPPDATDP